MTNISIIIPVFNEANKIENFIDYLKNNSSNLENVEILIVDGGSTDDLKRKIKEGENLRIIHSEKGRAKQMNAGAKMAKGSLLYFLHCDSYPPKHFDRLITEAVDKGNLAGCFRMKFDLVHPVLMVSQWFTRFNHISCRGGDQSLFISKHLFNEIDGFNEQYIIYEDNEIVSKLYDRKQFVVLPEYVITSARRYKENGIWNLQYHFSIIHLKRRLGHSAENMLEYYKKHVR